MPTSMRKDDESDFESVGEEVYEMGKSPFKNKWQEDVFDMIMKIIVTSNIPGMNTNHFDNKNDYVFGQPMILCLRLMSSRYEEPYAIKIIVPKNKIQFFKIEEFDKNNDLFVTDGAIQVLIREEHVDEDINRLHELLSAIKRE
jgi:hypothetical protein